MDHSHEMTPVDGPWAGGWVVAAVAALFAAWVAKTIGAVGAAPTALVACMTFLVFGALLGSGGVELPAPSDHSAHDAHDHP